MELETRELSNQNIEFLLKDSSPAKANALRRALIAEVPTLAIEDLKVYENGSVLFDEILALRLGLIPLKTDKEEFILPEECECGGEGCGQCQTQITLAGEGETTLHSSDLETQPGVEVPHQDIPIVKLAEGQELILEATAQLGKGREHAKWQPTIGCGYKTYPIQEIGEECDNCGECIETCPKDVYEIKNDELKIVDQEACMFCENCVEACPQDAINIKEDDTKFIFDFETDQSLPSKQILEEGIDIIIDKLEKFENNL
ncbi:DNA-directed RNA polymerase subunit D [archaeon SCG-AAA382B04]|nr:DNA-directed RNA polymerase subunit D [archaeon SCG-AAA382B04]